MTIVTKEQLLSLTPRDLLAMSRDNIEVARLVLNDYELLYKLGYHIKDNRIFGSSEFWKKFKPQQEGDYLFSIGYYLCDFLMAHKEIYDGAKANMDIIDRLSPHQLEALKVKFEGGDEYAFHKYGKK